MLVTYMTHTLIMKQSLNGLFSVVALYIPPLKFL